MKSKKIHESIGDLLKSKDIEEILAEIKHLSVEEKIKQIKKMQQTWEGVYIDLLSNDKILNDIRSSVMKKLDKMNIIEKVNYIEKLENALPDIFSGMRDEKTTKELRDFVMTRTLNEKAKFLWRFYRSWPDLFDSIKDDKTIDEETNKMLLLFKIKRAIDKGNLNELQALITEIGQRYGRENIIDFASNITIPEGRYNENKLFNSKDLNQLQLSLFKETRSKEEMLRDEHFNVYAFISYPEYKEMEINGETYYKKRIGIENLVKIDLYNAASLMQVKMMKIRASAQYDKERVYAVYVPKWMWDKEHAYNDEIPDDLREYIDKNKFKV